MSALISELTRLLSASPGFWQGTEVVLRFAALPLSTNEANQILTMLKDYSLRLEGIQTESSLTEASFRQFGVEIVPQIPPPNFSTPVEIRSIRPELSQAEDKNFLIKSLPANSTEAQTAFIGSQDGISLRSGGSISYPGNVVVLGDVNPGCQIRATGSIIVYGKLCGNVHAGYGLERESELKCIFVKALKMLEPLQISIGSFTSLFRVGEDTGNERSEGQPRSARLVDGQIWMFPDPNNN